MRDFDPCAFEERAAIAEYCGNATRLEAETLAAQQQDVTRWQALKFIKDATDANGSRHSGGGRDTDAALAGQSRADDLSRVQPQPKEEDASLPERKQDAGRPGVELPPLRAQRRGVL